MSNLLSSLNPIHPTHQHTHPVLAQLNIEFGLAPPIHSLSLTQPPTHSPNYTNPLPTLTKNFKVFQISLSAQLNVSMSRTVELSLTSTHPNHPLVHPLFRSCQGTVLLEDWRKRKCVENFYLYILLHFYNF